MKFSIKNLAILSSRAPCSYYGPLLVVWPQELPQNPGAVACLKYFLDVLIYTEKHRVVKKALNSKLALLGAY